MDDNDQVVEGEITEVTENENEQDPESRVASADLSDTGSDEAAILLSLEEMIKNHIESIGKLKEELKAQREMFEDSFANSPVYHENDEKVKEATKAKLSVKKQISSQPSVAILAQKVKDLRVDISEKNQTLSDLVADYKEKTGATQIETRDGKIMEIVSTVKLVKKNSKFNP
ncbi:MAG TPA: hypothetical protein VM077_03215 [Candidatus Limnocylindrales bacterium]|nr:hypothetical protein [Candidatus Limnocylindrales bacterium]